MQSIVFIILLSYIHVTIQQQLCVIGQLSLDEKKCIYAISPSLIAKNYFDAESDCKQKSEQVGIPSDGAFLVSIPNAFENSGTISRW